MRVLLTSGTGPIALAVARRLVRGGDRVVAVVRDPDSAVELIDLGVELRVGDLSRTAAIVDVLRGCEAAVHLAADDRVGIAASDRPAMLEANVGVTHRVLDAVSVARLERLVYVSTVGIFGDTLGRIVDERHRRDLAYGFLSHADETRFLAHRAVEERQAAGDPIVVVLPGDIYGSDDHSAVGRLLRGAFDGTLRYLSMTDTGISAVHADDVASGILAALDRGRPREAYILGGENIRLLEALRVAARLSGRPLPRLAIPTGLMRLGARMPAALARTLDLTEAPGEVVRTRLGVTHWASSAKAATELGYVPRDLASGLRAAFDEG